MRVLGNIMVFLAIVFAGIGVFMGFALRNNFLLGAMPAFYISLACFITSIFFFWMAIVQENLESINENVTAIEKFIQQSTNNALLGVTNFTHDNSGPLPSAVRMREKETSYARRSGDNPEIPRMSGENDERYWNRVRHS